MNFIERTEKICMIIAFLHNNIRNNISLSLFFSSYLPWKPRSPFSPSRPEKPSIPGVPNGPIFPFNPTGPIKPGGPIEVKNRMIVTMH